MANQDLTNDSGSYDGVDVVAGDAQERGLPVLLPISGFVFAVFDDQLLQGQKGDASFRRTTVKRNRQFAN